MKRAVEEQLLLAMPDVKILEVVGGFGLREWKEWIMLVASDIS